MIEAASAGHATVLADLDPLLPEPATLTGQPEDLLTARCGDSVAAGLMRTDVLAPDRIAVPRWTRCWPAGTCS